ncbi:MAG: PepSY domain-containing protein, partial [Lachnospiraceae bacterium]|nr:PepSY domain-containing protein [Lachnospiraceae bacterium]
MAVVLLAICAGAAKQTLAKNASIDANTASNFAYLDAGVDISEITASNVISSYENGKNVYRVAFQARGFNFAYVVNALDGTIINKAFEKAANASSAASGAIQGAASQAKTQQALAQQKAAAASAQAAAAKAAAAQASKAAAEKSALNAGNGYISVDQAKAIALQKAGLKEKDVTFSKAKLENDDGKKEYDIEFYRGGYEYEYEIDA